MAEITDFPVIQPTAEEKAAYEQQFGPPPLNPIRDLSASELADLASADKENFELVSAFRQNQDLWGNPEIVNKVADAHNQIKQRGFTLSDLPTAPRAAGMVWDVAKGFGKQLWNYGTAAVTGGMGLAADIAGASGIAEELGEEGTRRIAENIAGTEQALFGLSEMAARTAQKTGRALGISKPLTQFTPQEKVDDLWGAVGVGSTQEDISRGAGGFLTPVGGEVIRELAEEGKPVRPEEVNTLAAGDPFSFYLFGKGFQAAGAAVPAPVRAGVRQAGQKIAAGAEQAAGATVRALGNLTDLGGRAAQITGRAAPIVASGAAVAAGEPVTALAILGGSRPAARGLQTAGRKISAGGQSIVEAGRQVAGKPVVSPSAQVIKDVAYATPGAIGEVVSGTAADIGLAAVSSESPQQTESAVGIGTVFGAAAGARRVAGRVVSGQLIAPREYGVSTPVPSSGNFPAFDSLHSTAYSAAPPGVRARLNAVREFVRGAGIDSDVFMAPDAAALEKVLTDAGVAPETARQFSEQEGFFTTSLPDRSGTPRRVIVARNVEATPHESFHAFQDVLGEAANQQLDALVRQEYGPTWESEGTRYANRLVGDLGNRSWEEVVLDASGWGIDAAKEKIYREVYNMVESETGSAPPDAHVRDLADPELVRIFNEAQSRNPGASPEQFWREVLSPEEAKAEADRYIARELAAENFDAVFKNRGTTLTSGNSIPERLARVIGNVISTLGGEPLAGRRSEIGQIEPRFAVTEEVARLGREGAPGAPRRPTPEVPPTAPPRGTPPSPAGPAEEARTLAESAPETPLAGGTKSPRELLGQIAEAIAQQAGVKINYLSAPGEPAAATTSNRTARRAIIEAFRTMPAAARSLWEKTFFPERVRKTKAGYQIQGWAPEVFASNAHKLAETLSGLPEGQKLIPYELDVANKTFTEAGWRQLFEDTQTFVRNQMAGQTGAGKPLVVPAGVSERGFFAPQATPSRAAGLEQTRADAINMLFNFRLPDTPRVESGKLPLNIAGQEVSIATAGGPQRLSVPVEPRAPFSGERAQELGIEGRTILEVNPTRAAIERATSQAGIAMPSFVEAIQRLNLENIKEVQLAPEVPQFRGNTLTLSAGFQPNTNPRAIKAAAVRDEQGKIYEGAWHGEAEDIAVSLGSPTARGEFHTGFTTHGGEYLDRNQAYQRAQELQQISEADLKEFQTRVGPQLEAATFHAVKQFQPLPTTDYTETVKRMSSYNPAFHRGKMRKTHVLSQTTSMIPEYTEAANRMNQGITPEEWNSIPYAMQKRIRDILNFEYPDFPENASVRSVDSIGIKGQFQPLTETAQRLVDMTPEEWKATIGNYKGKLGGGLTGWAWDTGASAKSADDVLALRAVHSQLSELAKTISISEPGGFDRKMEIVGRVQAAREAYEAATGQNLEGTGEGSALPAIRKFVDSNYTPPVKIQAQPEQGEAPEYALRKPSGGFSKAWITPSGQPVQLGGKWHHEWLNENAEQYGITTGVNADAESRIQALRKGFARVNYGQNGGRLTVEARAADWAKLRASVQQFIEANLDQIDNLRIELFNDDVSAVADSQSAKFMNMENDQQRLSSIPFMENAPAGGATEGQVTGVAQARSRQFQPAAAEDQPEFAGMPKSTAKPFLTTAQLGSMNRNDLMAHFPEAIVPRRREDSIPSDILNAPLVKDAKNPTQTFGDKLAEFARSVEPTPEFQMGRKWYSEFAGQLKTKFGSDARVFAELLAATSPQTSVETNFKFALDALEGFKTGRFRTQIKKFEQGLGLIASDNWKAWYNKELNAGRIANPPAEPTPAAFMARWIEAHDLKPKQSNGKLYGINSIPVLQVAARRWLEQNKGPKVKNFVENLLGEGTEATIDLWADRTLRRLGYAGFEERWRILPINKRGVSDADFEFAQSVFRNAAEQLGLKPSELQAAVWFAEKKHWADNGWVRLDLGDFRNELKKTESLRAEIRGRQQQTPDLLLQRQPSQKQPVVEPLPREDRGFQGFQGFSPDRREDEEK